MSEFLDQLTRWALNPRYLVVEEVLLIAFVAIAWLAPRAVHEQLTRLERKLSGLARRPAASMLAVAAGLVLLRLALLPLFPVPEPVYHDEFSYLLGADTFARGRLTNPPHPLWEHFETLHVLSQPVYISMYAPAQAVLLAGGQLLGHPWIGALAAGAGMAAAFVWMLRGWMPPGWALLGGVLAALRLCLFNYWMNSYWGGALAALAGALVIGAAGRIARRRSGWFAQAILLAAGAAILANRRPYEGLALCAAVGLWLLLRLRGRVFRLAPGMAVVLVPVAAWMAYYNWRATGDLVKSPYQLAIETYHFSGFFLWESIGEPKRYRNAQMRDYYVEWERGQSIERRERFFYTTMVNLASLWRFLLGPALSLPFLAIPWLLRNRRIRPLLWIAAAGVVALSLTVWSLPHYASPFAPVLWVLLLQCMRYLRQWRRRGNGQGLAVVRAVVLVCVAMAAVPVVAALRGVEQTPSLSAWWSIDLPWDRGRVISELLSTPGPDLVIVRYAPGHHIHREWVYNSAGIDEQPVVWARELDGVDNRRLLDYFRGRRVWLLEVTSGAANLKPYPH